LVVIGIGGSYLGALALSQLLFGINSNNKKKIHFAGINLSADYHQQMLDELNNKDFAILVISKSGTTMETAIVFNIFTSILEKKYGIEQASKYIFAVTDSASGNLKKIADAKKYESFVIPNSIGGRFSVLTAVGLFPLAFLGTDIDQLIYGAEKTQKEISLSNGNDSCFDYGIKRTLLKNTLNKQIEIYESFEPRFAGLME
jgi:glucose-6-phosphate isomerase